MSVIDRYTRRLSDERGQSAAESEAIETAACFAMLRGIRERAAMLNLIKADGSSLAIGYAWLSRVAFDPSGTIILHAGDDRITIKGRNLNRDGDGQLGLLSGLLRHRILWIREAERSEQLIKEEAACAIDVIAW